MTTDLKARVSYLQGLSNGLDLNTESKEGKLFQEIIAVLGEFANTVDVLEEEQEQLEDYMDAINEDLQQLENELYDEGEVNRITDAGDYLEVECSGCGETVFFDAQLTEDKDVMEITCPECGEVVFANKSSNQAGIRPEMMAEMKTGSDLRALGDDI